MKKLSTILLFFAFLTAANAQLPNGSTAPDFTLSDINGNSHNLYSKLNQGKAVVLDFSASYCSTCWAYHNSGALSTFYNTRGPNATNYQANVYFVEVLANNTTGCLYGSGGGGMPFQPCTGSGSAGNWTAGTPYPIIDNSSLNTPYNINYFPMIYMVCPDKKAYVVGTQTAAQLDALMQTNCGITSGGGTTPLAISATNVVTNNKCFGENKGAVALTVSGGTPPFTYQWNNNQTTQNIANLYVGNYQCTITDSQSKTLITNNISVSQGNQIAATATVVNNQKCGVQGAINLSASGGNNNFQYLWNTGATNANLANVTTAGTYKVTLTDGLGCTFVKDNIVLQSANNQPTASFTNTLALNCTVNNGQLKGAVLPKIANYTYTWTAINGGNIVNKTDTSAFVNAAGTYNFKVEDKDSKCLSTATYQVLSNTITPQITPVSSTAVLTCTVKDLQLSATVLPQNPNYTYTWTATNGGNILNKTNALATVNAAGTYNLKVENTTNNCSNNKNYQVTSDANLPQIMPVSSATVLTCTVKDLQLSATVLPQNPNYVYTWTSSNGGNILNKMNASATVNAAGTYNLKVENTANNCSSISAFQITADTKIPKITFAPNTDNILTCKKTTIVLFPTITEAGALPNFVWSSQNAGTFTGSTTAANATVNTAATYNVKVTNTQNGCQSDASLSITKAENPTLILSENNKILCFGEKMLDIMTNTDKTQTPISFLWSNKETTSTLKNVGAGAYILTITDAYGCSVTKTLTATEPTPLKINVTNTTKPTGLTSNGAISIDAAGGVSPYQYAWTKNDIAFSNTKNLTALSAGTYKLVLTDANKCILKSETIILLATVTSVGDVDGLLNFKAFPNPSNNEVNVYLQLADNQKVKANLYDAFGKLIESKNVVETNLFQTTFDISALPNAVYFLRLEVGKQQIIEKIVKF